jgi:hypothetical protein
MFGINPGARQALLMQSVPKLIISVTGEKDGLCPEMKAANELCPLRPQG